MDFSPKTTELMNEQADRIVAAALQCRKDGCGVELTRETVFINTKDAMLQLASEVRREALEEAADECEAMMMYPNGREEAPKHNNVWQAAKAIRNLIDKEAP